MRRLLSVAALAGLALALAACGSGPTSSAAPTGTAAAAGDPGPKSASCDLASPADIKTTLGLDVAAPTSTVNDTVTMCQYGPVPGGTRSVILRIDTASSAEKFQQTRDGYASQQMTTTDYPGFGDQAYTNTISAIGITTNTLVARKGGVEMQVSSGASFDQEKALEQKLFDALA
jgi:hypothetical protein